MTDTGLERFVAAQAPVIDDVMVELAQGSKRTHWMWFVFPQIRGLGASDRARHFAIADMGEACSYLAHPILGSRLIACTRLVLGHKDKTAFAIFGSPDDRKFRSSMTLFALAAPEETEFVQALDAFFGGDADKATLDILAIGPA